MMKNFFKRYTPLQIAMHIYAWSALVRIIIDYFNHNLTANPIQALEQRTGRHAITLLVLSLACTPLNTIFKWSEPIKRRRALGLYAFFYVCIHLIIYIFDYQLAWDYLVQNIVQKPRIIVGLLAFFFMIPLAITSFDIWKVRLGKSWKRLHSFVYFVAPLAVLHFLWSKKGDILTLQGEVLQPLVYGIIVAVFLILRIPTVRKAFASFSPRTLFSRRKEVGQTEQA